MAALETFAWIVSSMEEDPSPPMRQFIDRQRDDLLTLRSEDERQRFVDEFMQELRRRSLPKPGQA
jgi:hypothetical protein